MQFKFYLYLISWIVDSHIHMNDNEYDPIIEYISRFMNRNHIKACCVSTNYSSSVKTLLLSNKSSVFLPFVGIHPNQIEDDIDVFTKFVRSNINKIKGIGEIGLDKTYTHSNYEFKKQISYFMMQLELAEKLNKPISIHSRNALDEVYSILTSYSISKVSLHWFDGTQKQLKQAMDLGFFVSYGPLLVYSKDKQSLLLSTNIDNILLETDGPVRFSRCFKYRPTQVLLIPSIIVAVSKLLDIPYTDLITKLEANSNKFLHI